MTKRPILILLAGLLFLYFPAELLFRWRSDASLTPVEIFLSGALPFLVMLGLLRVTRLGWYTLIAFVLVWGVNDVSLFFQLRGANVGTLLAHLLIYSLSLSYFINPRIRTLYFDPKLCWWKTKPRYETNLPLILNDGQSWHYPILRNVSEGGCFVETPRPMPLNAKLALSIPLPIPLNVPVIHTQGHVRWVSRDPMRCGMGIEFLTDSSQQRKAIRQYVRQQL